MEILRSLVELFPMYELDGIKRYYITLKDRKSFNVFVHSITSSRLDNVFHNHPWLLSVSFVLKGGYDEEIMHDKSCKLRKRRRFSVVALTQGAFHRVVSAEGDTWTLFVTLCRSERAWGFKNEHGVRYEM